MTQQQASKYENAIWDFELKLKDLATEARREELPELAASIETCAGCCHSVWALVSQEWNRLERMRIAQPIADELAKEAVAAQ